MSSLNAIRKDWSYLCQTADELDRYIREAKDNQEMILDCFYLAQTLNNQFDYFESRYKLSYNSEITRSVFENYKKHRDELYHKFYEVLSAIPKKRVVEIINQELGGLLEEYKKRVINLDLEQQKIFSLLEIRDKIKILYEELQFWFNKWTEMDESQKKYKVCSDEYCSQINKVDDLFNKFIIAQDKTKLGFITKEAKNRLIMKPDGSIRFNYWWWYVAD